MRIFIAYPYKLTGYREDLASALPEPEYELMYADEHLHSDHVLRKIERMLEECDLALFDVTGGNPNVTLELGIAIAAQHPYVVVIQKDAVKELNADIHGWDQLRYESVAELSETLKAYIERGRVPMRVVREDETTPNVSPLGQKPFPAVFLTPHANNPDSIFGLRITPETYNTKRHTMTPEDDDALLDAEGRSRGAGDSHLHGPLAPGAGYVNGALFASPDPQQQRSGGGSELPFEQIMIDSDGEIVIRFRQNDNRPLFQYLALLATGYTITQDVYMHFGIKPKVHVHLVLTLDARRQNDKVAFPSGWDDYFDMDVRDQRFADAFLDPTMRLLRASSTPMKSDEVRSMLERFERDQISAMPTNRTWK